MSLAAANVYRHSSPTCGRDMIQSRPVAPISKLYGRPVDCVEVDVVLSHELVQVDVLWVEPPLLPFRSVIGGNTRVADWSIVLFKRLVSSDVTAILCIRTHTSGKR